MTAWRTIVTDSESLTGVAPVCERQDDPSGPHWSPAGPTWLSRVFDCCSHQHIEVWSEAGARIVADQLSLHEAEVGS